MEIIMNNLKNIPMLLLSAFAMLLSSCEDPVDVDVKPGEPKWVIDAFINNSNATQLIKITRSIPYFSNPNLISGIEGAEILLLDTTQKKFYAFADSGNGNYIFKPNPLTGDTFSENSVYALFIRINDDTLYSLSKLNPTAHFDSLKVIEEKGSIGIADGKYIEMVAKDRIGKGSTYWIKTFYNDTFRGKVFEMNLAWDESFSSSENDGGEFIWPIRYGALNDFNKPYKTGDKIRVEIHSITKETFYYLSAIQAESQNGGLFATPPVSIRSNIISFNPNKPINTAGWFNMASVVQKIKVIP